MRACKIAPCVCYAQGGGRMIDTTIEAVQWMMMMRYINYNALFWGFCVYILNIGHDLVKHVVLTLADEIHVPLCINKLPLLLLLILYTITISITISIM